MNVMKEARRKEVARKHRLARHAAALAEAQRLLVLSQGAEGLANQRARAASAQAQRAVSEAFNRLFHKKDLLECAMQDMLREVAREVGPRVAEQARKMLDAAGQQARRPVRFDIRADAPIDFEARTIETIQLTAEMPAWRLQQRIDLW